MQRDPRVDPRVGDVLRKKYQGRLFEARGYIEREVSEVDDPDVCYVGPDVCEPRVSIRSWRRWAKNAKVIHAAPEAQ